MVRRSLPAAILTLAALSAVAFSAPMTGGASLASSHPRVGARQPAGQTGNAGWASSNWSGYAVTGGTGAFNAVTGAWTVAPVSGTNKQTFSSSWIGIDGFNNSNLIQTGTEADYYNGAAHYDAWWEILPAAETVIPSITVRPNDSMSASIKRGSGSSWTITITDATTGQSFNTVQSYSGPETSAEWIEEAPTVGGRIATLAHYSEFAFDPGTVNANQNPGLTAADSGVMVQHGAQVSTPSLPDRDTDGFNSQYGAAQPPPPAS